MDDLNQFLGRYEAQHIHVRRPVELEQIGALTAQADDTIVFHDIAGYPGWRLVDQLFVNRAAQARVLGCEPTDVVPRLLEVLQEGPKPLREVDEGPLPGADHDRRGR